MLGKERSGKEGENGGKHIVHEDEERSQRYQGGKTDQVQESVSRCARLIGEETVM